VERSRRRIAPAAVSDETERGLTGATADANR
jgi:hypothetical protein